MLHNFRADLHCHSTCSDGSDAPEELLHKAKQAGLQGLSITDHDTLAAYTPELFALSQSLSIQLLVGTEISTEWEGVPVHILGYAVELGTPRLTAFLTEIQTRRNERNRIILKKLSDRKMHIEESELMTHIYTIGRPHIAALLVKKGYVSSIQEAFERYLKDGASCWSPGSRFSPKEAIDQIRAAKGKAILAHPHFYKQGFALRKILSFPFDGIETHYAALPKAMELPWIQIAQERGWIATGGSDYHGTIKPRISLGASWVGEKVFHELYKAH